MKAVLGILAVVVIALLAIVLFDFRLTDSGSLPEVSVTGGDMPNAEIRGPAVNVTTETKTVEVPTDINIETKTEGFEIPTDIDFELPEDTESNKDIVE